MPNGEKPLVREPDREQAYIAAVANLYSSFESTTQQARLLAYRDAMQGLASIF